MDAAVKHRGSTIGLQNEGSLHSAIKEWYSLPMDRHEVDLEGFVIDIVRDGMLIEVQTRNFSAIRRKLRELLKGYQVRLIYPVAQEKWIVRMTDSGDVLSRRRSPKKGNTSDVFDELVSMPDIINEDNFSLEVLMIKEEQIWCQNGKGSWRRKGASVVDRRLIEVTGRVEFKGKEDFIGLLPRELPNPFTNKELAALSGIKVSKAQKMTYCLKKMGAIREAGKRSRELLFETDMVKFKKGSELI